MFESEVSGDMKWVFVRAKGKMFSKVKELKIPSDSLDELIEYLDSGPPAGSTIDESASVLASRDETNIDIRFGKKHMMLEPADVEEFAQALEAARKVIDKNTPKKQELVPALNPTPSTEDISPNPVPPLPTKEEAAAATVRANTDFLGTLMPNADADVGSPAKFPPRVFVPERAKASRDIAAVNCPACKSLIVLGEGAFDGWIVGCPNRECGVMILIEDK